MGLNISTDPQALQKLLFGSPQAAMFGAPGQDAQSSPFAPPPAAVQASATPAASPGAPAPSSAPAGTPPAPTAKPAPSFEDPNDYAAAHPEAVQAHVTPRPVGDFDTGAHAGLRRALATMFGGLAEFGGDLNHNPGQGGRLFNRWAEQDAAQRAYDAGQPQMRAGAVSKAFEEHLAQTGQQAGTAHQEQETENLRENSPAIQRKAQFLSQLQTEAESGKYDPISLKGRALRIAQANRIPIMPEEIDDVIQNTKALGAKYQIQQDKSGRPEFATDRQGNRIFPDAKGKFQDPELQSQWDSISASHQTGLAEEEEKEKRVAGFAAERQAAGFQQATQMEGRKAAAPYLADINDAKNQQKLISDLLSGKMNPASQTAAMFKMIGLEQPTGTHRIMPAEIEGIEHLGGVSDKLKQKLLNWKEGDRFSPDLVPDVIATAKILSQNKVKNANDNLQSTYRNTGYKVEGSDGNGRMDKPEDYQQGAAATGNKPPAGATHTGIGSVDKKKHWLDANGKDLGLAE